MRVDNSKHVWLEGRKKLRQQVATVVVVAVVTTHTLGINDSVVFQLWDVQNSNALPASWC